MSLVMRVMITPAFSVVMPQTTAAHAITFSVPKTTVLATSTASALNTVAGRLTALNAGLNSVPTALGSSLTGTTTLALYMPGSDYAEVAWRLREGGLPDDLPCVIVSHATGAEQQIRWTSLARLAGEEKLPAPALMIVANAVAVLPT